MQEKSFCKIELEIPESITGKARPRFGKNGGVYTPGKTKNYEYLVRQLFVYKYPNFIPLEERIKIIIIAYFELPKKVSKIKEAEMLADIISPTKKPDIDNITKIILDALNKFAYKDDAQITEIKVIKKYSRTPKVIVQIEEY